MGLSSPRPDPQAAATLNNFAAVDLDLDENLDLVLANVSGTLSLLTGDGRGGFAGRRGRVSLPGSPKPEGIAIGDLDGDGKQDIAVALPNSNKIQLLVNTTSVVNTVFPLVLSVQDGTILFMLQKDDHDRGTQTT